MNLKLEEFIKLVSSLMECPKMYTIPSSICIAIILFYLHNKETSNLFITLCVLEVAIVFSIIHSFYKNYEYTKSIKQWWGTQDDLTRIYIENHFIDCSIQSINKKQYLITVPHDFSKHYRFANCEYLSYQQDIEYPERGTLIYDKQLIKMFDKEKIKLKLQKSYRDNKYLREKYSKFIK